MLRGNTYVDDAESITRCPANHSPRAEDSTVSEKEKQNKVNFPNIIQETRANSTQYRAMRNSSLEQPDYGHLIWNGSRYNIAVFYYFGQITRTTYGLQYTSV